MSEQDNTGVTKQEIPCEQCATKKENIDGSGLYEFISCEPIATRPGWCLFVFKDI